MTDNYLDYLQHYGVKGMKWGVRNDYEPTGRHRFRTDSGTSRRKVQKELFQDTAQKKKITDISTVDIKYMRDCLRTRITGKQYVDTILAANTTFSRIQTDKNFGEYAFYATYKKKDIEKYMGLFGTNLTNRAKAAARRAEKQARKTDDYEDILNARSLRDKSDNLKVYQLQIKATNKLRVPSDKNAGNITAKLLNDSDFKKNVMVSLQDSKAIMKRPTQQALFNYAMKSMNKNPKHLSEKEKVTIYKALNLSLTNHNPQEVAAQNKLYSELKKNGYNALLDYNDKEFSSYHAKRPVIVFDTDSVKLDAVVETNPKVVKKYYKRYNTERMIKETAANTIGYINKRGHYTVSQCESYVNKRLNDYVSR